MPLPHWVARLNKRLTNRFIEPVVRRSRHFVVVHHVGRVTGAPHATPLFAFRDDTSAYVALTYGPNADWVRNVLAGEASITDRTGGHLAIVGPVVVSRKAAAHAIPRHLAVMLRVLRVSQYLRFEIH